LNGAVAFEQKGGRSHQAEQERTEYLEKKIQTRDQVLAELIDHREIASVYLSGKSSAVGLRQSSSISR
jgi:hypothetical protein